MVGQDLRYLIPAAIDHVYLNAAMVGPTPTSAMTAATAAELEWQEVGPGHFPFYQGARAEATRFQNRLQFMLPGGTVHLANTHRDAIMTVLYGLDLREGDQIITTDQEDASMLGALIEVARRFRLRVLVLKVGGLDLIDELEHALSASTRLVALSHVSPESGWAMPIAELAQRIHAWPDVRFLIDGAQAWGNIEVNVDASGADFYVLCGHKWLMAPPPAAALWVRYNRGGELTTVTPDEDRDVRLRRLEESDWEIAGDRVTSAATQPWPRLVGWALCLDYFEEEGFATHAAYQRDLARICRDSVRGMARLEVMDPTDPSMATNLMVLRSRVLDGHAFAERLWAENIFVHPLSGGRGVRISWASFNIRDDVERLIQALHTVHQGY